MCRSNVGEPAGTCPFGSMKVKVDPNIHCGGFEEFATIVVKYKIPGGVQSKEHENPGQHFKGTKRKAYVPIHCKRKRSFETLEILCFASELR